MTITLIAAVARNGTIGAEGGLPWHLPADLKHFKALTMGRTMIMGRRTYESIGRALPGRRTIVVTRDPNWSVQDADIAHSVEAAIELATVDGEDAQVMIVGGGEIYRQTIDMADRLEITHVDVTVDGDTRFPDIDSAAWRVAVRQEADGYAFVSYVRRRPLRDLHSLLSAMDPTLDGREFVFCALGPGIAPAAEYRPVATIEEAEGITVVLPVAEAESAGLDGTFRSARITLMVPSALGSVGLTAAVSSALARDGIACNIIAGFHHDHLFVPVGRADDAMAALAALAHTRIPDTQPSAASP